MQIAESLLSLGNSNNEGDERKEVGASQSSWETNHDDYHDDD